MNQISWDDLLRRVAGGDENATQQLQAFAREVIQSYLSRRLANPRNGVIEDVTEATLNCVLGCLREQSVRDFCSNLEAFRSLAEKLIEHAMQPREGETSESGNCVPVFSLPLTAATAPRYPPELHQWALQGLNEKEVAEDLKELREKGGLRLSDFLAELEQIVEKQ